MTRKSYQTGEKRHKLGEKLMSQDMGWKSSERHQGEMPLVGCLSLYQRCRIRG
jgi:hypothetical protein